MRAVAILVAVLTLGLVYASGTLAQEEHTQEEKEQYVTEVDQVFEEKCTACHDRTRVDLEEESVSMRAWMHIVDKMRKKAPEFISKEQARLLQREYIDRIKKEIENLERQLEILERQIAF